MLIVHVHVQVKADRVQAFREATLENATASVQEPGVVRFDVLQSLEDATRFVLVEVYRDEQAPAQHKQTAHYEKWRDAVSELMASPRTSVKYQAAFPSMAGWEMARGPT